MKFKIKTRSEAPQAPQPPSPHHSDRRRRERLRMAAETANPVPLSPPARLFPGLELPRTPLDARWGTEPAFAIDRGWKRIGTYV